MSLPCCMRDPTANHIVFTNENSFTKTCKLEISNPANYNSPKPANYNPAAEIYISHVYP